MTLTIPDDALAAVHLSQQEVCTELAVGLFSAEKITLARAAQISGINLLAFQRLLRTRRIPLHYGTDELHDDLHDLESDL